MRENSRNFHTVKNVKNNVKNFREINFGKRGCNGTVWKLREFSLMHFYQKFRESKEITKELISRKIFFVVRQFLAFPQCSVKIAGFFNHSDFT